jgi:hypothetical protein
MASSRVRTPSTASTLHEGRAHDETIVDIQTQGGHVDHTQINRVDRAAGVAIDDTQHVVQRLREAASVGQVLDLGQDDGRDDDPNSGVTENNTGTTTQTPITADEPGQGVGIYDVGFHSRSSGTLYSAALMSS